MHAGIGRWEATMSFLTARRWTDRYPIIFTGIIWVAQFIGYTCRVLTLGRPAPLSTCFWQPPRLPLVATQSIKN
jgi:hypothetical protein